MADTSAAEIPKALAQQIQPMQSPLPSSTPMEMTTLGEQVEVVGDNLPGAGSSASHSNALAPPVSSSEATGDGSQDGELGASYVKPTANTNIPSQVLAGTSISSAVGQSIMHPDTLTREKTAPAIGPSSDKPVPSPKESEIVGPVLMITLLLINGVRHFYKFDEKYLKKRNLNVEGNNPINMSTYTLKELIWKEWREGRRRYHFSG